MARQETGRKVATSVLPPALNQQIRAVSWFTRGRSSWSVHPLVNHSADASFSTLSKASFPRAAASPSCRLVSFKNVMHNSAFRYQVNTELMASEYSLASVLSMQQVSINSYSISAVRATVQAPRIFSTSGGAGVPNFKSARCLLKSWRVTSLGSQRCDRMAYVSWCLPPSNTKFVVFRSRMVWITAVSCQRYEGICEVL